MFPGILMELKAAAVSEIEKLPELADEALRQMDDRSYKTDMLEREVERIMCYGIALSGKQVEVRTQKKESGLKRRMFSNTADDNIR